MVEKEFKLKRKIYVGSRINKEPLPKPLPEEKEPQKRFIRAVRHNVPDENEMEDTQVIFDRKDLIQGARNFILRARDAGATNIGNLVNEFARWNIEQRYLFSHLPDFKTADNLVEHMNFVQSWEVKLFHAQIKTIDHARAVLRQLHNSNVYELDYQIFDELPLWSQINYVPTLKEFGDYSQIDDQLQPFVILSEFATEYAESGLEDITCYEAMSKLLQSILRDSRAQEMAVFIKSFMQLDEDHFEIIYKKNFKEDTNRPLVKRMYQLFANFLLQTYQAITDIDDPRHADSKEFLTDFIHSPTMIGSIDERIETFTIGAVKRGMKNQLDEVTLIKNLYNLAESHQDGWYSELAKRMKGVVEKASRVMIYNSDKLQSFFVGEKKWSDQNWLQIETICNELSLTNRWIHLAKKDDLELAIPVEFVTARLRKEGDILFGQLFFVHSTELIELASKTGELNQIPFSIMTFAIDLQPQHQALYLRLIEEDFVNESLQAHMLSITHELLVHTLKRKREKTYVPTEAENVLTRIQGYDIAPVKEKGSGFTPRAKHKRPRITNGHHKEVPSVRKAKSFVEEIQEKRLWPKFVLPEKVITELQEKFNDADINRIKQKLMQANHGAGMVKTYPDFQGPRGEYKVWAIRLNKQIRILAQEGIEKGQAHVFAVEFKSELEKK